MSKTAEEPSNWRLGKAALAVPTFSERGGGVAYVSRLLRAALTDRNHTPRDYELTRSVTQNIPIQKSVLFGLGLLRDSALRRMDWILFGHPGISEAQRWIPRPVRLPFVVQLHGTEAWEENLPTTVRQAGLRIAPSRFTARRCLEVHPELQPIVVCPHGLLREAPTSAALPDEELLSQVRPQSALIVGRMNPSERRKGHDQLLECWPAVRGSLPDAQLVIAGEGGDSTRLKRKAAEIGISDAVFFTGFLSDATLKSLFERVGLMAMPSRQEGFGIVYLEGMKAGLPCIGATEDGASEPIVHGVTGLLVEQSDRQQLAQAIVSLLGDETRRRSFGHAGRRRFESEFTFERYRERLLAALSENFPLRPPESTPSRLHARLAASPVQQASPL